MLTYFEPLEIDITTYAVIANEMLHGKYLYKDLWDHKGPGTYLIFALSQIIFGYNQNSIFAINIAFSIASLFAIASITKTFGTTQNLAIILWALLSGELITQSNQPNCEVLILPFILFGIANLLKIDQTDRNKYLLYAGTLFAIASTIKQLAIILIVLFAFTITIILITRSKSIITSIKCSLIFIFPVVVCWLGIFLYFFLNGNFSYFYECVFQYNKEYIGVISDNLLPIEQIYDKAPNNLVWIFSPYLILGVVGLFYQHKSIRKTLIFTCYLLSTFLMVMIPGKYYPHYYTLLIPVILLLASEGMRCISKNYAMHFLLISLLPFLIIEVPILLKPSAEISKMKYHYDLSFDNTRTYALFLKEKVPSNYKLLNIGYDTGLFFYSKLSPSTSLFYDFPLTEKSGRLARVFKEFEANPPEIIVTRNNFGKKALISKLTENLYIKKEEYSKLNFDFYIRKDLENSLITN